MPDLVRSLRERGVWFSEAFEVYVLNARATRPFPLPNDRPRPMAALLRAWGSLPPAQRRALEAGQAVPLRALSARGRQWLRIAVWESAEARSGELPPGLVEDGTLSLETVAAHRRVSEDPDENRTRIGYYIPGPPGVPDGDVIFEDRTVDVALVPDLVRPQEGPGQELRFRFRTAAGPGLTFKVLLHRAELRDSQVGAPR